jgi:hypothetical protein
MPSNAGGLIKLNSLVEATCISNTKKICIVASFIDFNFIKILIVLDGFVGLHLFYFIDTSL